MTLKTSTCFRRNTALIFLFVLLAGSWFTGCGKTGPLRHPDDVRPAMVQTLAVEVSGGRVLLSWIRPDKRK